MRPEKKDFHLCTQNKQKMKINQEVKTELLTWSGVLITLLLIAGYVKLSMIYPLIFPYTVTTIGIIIAIMAIIWFIRWVYLGIRDMVETYYWKKNLDKQIAQRKLEVDELHRKLKEEENQEIREEIARMRANMKDIYNNPPKFPDDRIG
jgi:hypothetical protein